MHIIEFEYKYAKSDMQSMICTFMRGSRKISTLMFLFFVCFFFLFVDEGRKGIKLLLKLPFPAKRHLDGVSLTSRGWPNIKCWLGSFEIFQEIQTSIAKKHTLYFCDFPGGGEGIQTHCTPHLDLCMTFLVYLGHRTQIFSCMSSL